MKPRTNPNRLWICFDRVRCTIACKSATAYESEIIPFDGKILTPATTENFSSRLCEIQRLGINSGHSAWPPWSRKRQARAQCSNRWAPRSKDTALCSLHHARALKQRWTLGGFRRCGSRHCQIRGKEPGHHQQPQRGSEHLEGEVRWLYGQIEILRQEAERHKSASAKDMEHVAKVIFSARGNHVITVRAKIRWLVHIR